MTHKLMYRWVPQWQWDVCDAWWINGDYVLCEWMPNEWGGTWEPVPYEQIDQKERDRRIAKLRKAGRPNEQKT